MEDEYVWSINASTFAKNESGEEKHQKELDQSTRFVLFIELHTDLLQRMRTNKYCSNI